MRRQKGGHVCPRCGAEGSAFLDDGTEAEFETPNRGSLAWPLGLSLLAIILAGAAGAAWWFRDALPFDLLRPALKTEVAAAATPDWRMARLGEFGEELRGGVIGVFGTDGEDRLLAFTPLASGELVTVLSHPGTEEPARRASLVRLDGSAELRASGLVVPEGITGASLAPAGVSGFYLAVTGPTGVRLAAYGEGAAPVWERRVERSVPPQKSALVLTVDGAAVLVGPAEAAGRIAVAAYDPAGAQLWQRTFEAPEDGRVFARQTDADGVFVAYESLVSGEAAEASALWLSAGGETLQAASGLRLDGRLAGALGETAGLVLLEESSVVRLVGFSSAGDRLFAREVASALLRDRITLAESDGALVVRAAYALSDIQTDFSEAAFDTSGSETGLSIWRLPAHTVADLASSMSGASSLLAGTIGHGAGADAFVLVLPRASAAGLGEVAESAGYEPRPLAEAAPPPVQTEAASSPAAVLTQR